MARILAAGAAAWDRPVRLSGPLASGARLSGFTLADPEGGLEGRLGGRLGGGGANAAAALAAAGCAAAVLGPCPSGAAEARVRAALAEAGVERAFLVPMESRGATLILIEPGGERMILGLDPPEAPRIDPALFDTAVHGAIAWGFDALYLRAPIPGGARLAAAARGPVAAHWPGGPEALAAADVLIGSTDDLGAGAHARPLAAARAAGSACAWAVVTDGPRPLAAEGPLGRIEITPPTVQMRDATGAGDVFAAGVLQALTAGAAMPEALAHGCAWGAAAAGMEASAPMGPDRAAFQPFKA